jgi:formylglycine-generating enzyme
VVLPRRAVEVAGLAAPAMLASFVFVLLATGGCSKRTQVEARSYEPRLIHQAPAFARGGAKNPRPSHARTAGGLGFLHLDFGRTATPDTPLDQLLGEGDRPLAGSGLCPPDMASVEDLYCVDRYEASLLEILPNGEERPWSSFSPVDDGKEGNGAHASFTVRAISEPGLVPQAYVSEMQAKEACARSGKRLCKPVEWRKACTGPNHSTYGYGNQDEPRRCNDHGRGPLGIVFGMNGDDPALFTWPKMNDPQLNQLAGTVAKSGDFEGCVNGYGIHDMVGNLHEWVDDPEGTFLGGYYQDTHQNGDGCGYRTMAHAAWYHDYSTGFRCCADVAQ